MTLHDYLFTLLLSMAPVSELRGAIPFGLAHDIPQALLYPSCILANLLPVPFVIVFLRRILSWMQRRGGKLASAACWLEHRGRAKSARIKRSELLGLYLFVAIPSHFSSGYRFRAPAHGPVRWSRRCWEGGFLTPCSPLEPA